MLVLKETCVVASNYHCPVDCIVFGRANDWRDLAKTLCSLASNNSHPNGLVGQWVFPKTNCLLAGNDLLTLLSDSSIDFVLIHRH